MRPASDHIHPTPSGGRCRVRVYSPEDEGDAPVVICTRSGGSLETLNMMDAPERIAGEVLLYLSLPYPVVWVEHFERGAGATEPGNPDAFWLVHFDAYERKSGWRGERVLLQGIRTRPLDRASVEALVGGPV